MTATWRRCEDCGKRRAIPRLPWCRPCHGTRLLDQIDRILVNRGELTSWHRFQHEYHHADETTCPLCISAAEARTRLAQRERKA